MICQVKPIKSQTSKDTSIDKAFSQRERGIQIEDVTWSPFTAGPYLVPVTRWVE